MQTLKITFPLELTPDQQAIFVRSFQMIQEATLAKFKTISKLTRSRGYLFINGTTGLYMNNGVQNIINNINDFIKLGQDDNDKKTYLFQIDDSQFSFVRNLPGRIEQGSQSEKMFKDIKKRLKDEVFPRMAVEYEKVIIEVI